MKRFLFVSLLFFFSGTVCSEEILPEIQGPQSAFCGNLVVFEVTESADWCLIPLEKSVGKWSIDTSGKTLYFASSEPGIYTVCAAIVVEGQPKIHSKTFSYGDEKIEPKPQWEPEPDDIGTWIRANSVEFSQANSFAEKEMFTACFQSMADGIQQGSVRSAQAVRAKIRTCVATKMLSCSAESRKHWMQFFEALAEEIENRCKKEPNNLQRMKTLFYEITKEMSKS